LYIQFFLPESLKSDSQSAVAGSFRENFRLAFRTPGLAVLLAMFFAYNLGFTNLESTFFRLLHEPNWIFAMSELDARNNGAIILSVVGVVGVVMQGFVLPKLTPIYGEVRLLRFSYLLVVPALLLLPYAPFWIPALLIVLLLGIGSGLSQPSLSSLVSRNAPSTMQGGIFGITQALGAFARILGPIVSNSLFTIKPSWPYLLAGVLCLIPAVAVWWIRQPDEPEVQAAQVS
jgi:MFS-type transporter involved in bile tolerance (Atg22 family)